MRGELETGRDCNILTQSFSDHSSTSSAFWLGYSTVGHWGSASWFSCWYLVPNWLQLQLEFELQLELIQAVCGTWLYNCLTSTCFLCAYASAPNSTTSTGQGDIPISSTGFTCFTGVLLIYTGASLDWRFGRGSIWYRSPVFVSPGQYWYIPRPFRGRHPDSKPPRWGYVYYLEPEACFLGECRRNKKHFRKCRWLLGNGSMPGTTWKKSLFRIHTFGGAFEK